MTAARFGLSSRKPNRSRVRPQGRRQSGAMFYIRLSDFRCFASDSPAVEVRPITFLVGENSAGKTSFLAGTRLLLESFVRAPQNPFNRDPYHLGGFQQIARYRGGRGGRADRFSLELMVPASTGDQTSQRPRPRQPSTEIRHKLTFGKGAPQPELISYEFGNSELLAIITVSDKVSVNLVENGKVVAEYRPERLPPMQAVRRDVSYLRFVFDELAYSRNSPASEDRALRERINKLTQQFRQSFKYVATRVFASAPVRTQPLRTYTPSEVTGSSEGAHVPLEMARQKMSASNEWESVHNKLNQFGTDSGMFDDIDIRQLGKHDGDPFQVMVRTGGPTMNIVDVGYGVSQVLPILYQLDHVKQYDAFLLQQPEIHLHPRAQAELGTVIAKVSKQKQNSIQIIETHSDYIIDRVRMEVAAKRLDHSRVTIVFFDRQKHAVQPSNIYLNEAGEILGPPENYRAFFLKEQQMLLGL